ncbi:MAG: hypothetical protein KAT93_06135, partial [Desulfuromonadales bacterium]|nr:hypothetical protein [Desulfuromonadales bacterium]
YRKLFLNKAVQQIDEAFKADAWGNYLQREDDEDHEPITLAKHRTAILAAFRITDEELEAILQIAEVIDDVSGTSRKLDVESDILNIQNLSTIFRYVVLAKALKVKVTDLCKLISLSLFSASPFSTWDMDREEFIDISPKDSYEFYQLAVSIKESGFKPSVLEYILQGTLPVDSTFGLDKNKILQTAKTIREAFATIEQAHPETLKSPLTAEILTAKLSLTFQPEIVRRFMGIVEGTASFETETDENLNILIPDADAQDKIEELVAAGTFLSRSEAAAFLRKLSRKYAYVNDSGRLICTGVMSDIERTVLKGLTNVNPHFEDAVDELYAAAETFISYNFNGVFSNLADANEMLLGRTPAGLDERLGYVYEHFLPLLKSKLRKDAITQHIASLIGLSEEATALLISDDIEALIADLSIEGYSGTYFSDADWTTDVLSRPDRSIDFSWENTAPDSMVPADIFSVRWKAYIAAPASGTYTLMVEVEEDDEIFNLYLDNTLILEKTTTDTNTLWEINADLNAAEMHLLTLEYADFSEIVGVRLYWKKTDSAPEIISSSVAYPSAILDAFAAKAIVFHRAAKYILGFGISETELNHFKTYNGDFADIDFMALEAEHFKRVNSYMTLRNAVPQAQALMTDVFALANRPNPPEMYDLTETLRLATAWDETCLSFLINPPFVTSIDDFKNEIALNRIH